MGVTGLTDRKSYSFLWICVLGLNTKLIPDTDPLVRANVQLHHFHSKLLSNKNGSAVNRSDSWIQSIQKQRFDLCANLTFLFTLPVNTKLHCVMCHIEDHVKSFGTLLWGATE